MNLPRERERERERERGLNLRLSTTPRTVPISSAFGVTIAWTVFSSRYYPRPRDALKVLRHSLSVCLFVADCVCLSARWAGCLVGAISLCQSVCRTADVECRRHLRSSTTMTLVVPSVQRLTVLLVTAPFLSLHRGHGTAYHLPSELFHPSPPFGNN